MNIKNIVEEYYNKREIFLKTSRDLEEVKKILKPNISKILKMYHLKEYGIYTKYKIFHCAYQYIVPYDDYEDFEIIKETKDYILVECYCTDSDGDSISMSIKLPKNLDQIDLYVEQFGNEIESKLVMKTLINK